MIPLPPADANVALRQVIESTTGRCFDVPADATSFNECGLGLDTGNLVLQHVLKDNSSVVMPLSPPLEESSRADWYEDGFTAELKFEVVLDETIVTATGEVVSTEATPIDLINPAVYDYDEEGDEIELPDTEIEDEPDNPLPWPPEQP